MHSVLGARYDKRGDYHGYVKGERLDALHAVERDVLHAGKQAAGCLCGDHNAGLHIAGIDRWGLEASTVLCEKCGLVRVSPRWEDETYINIYKNYFWALQSGTSTITKERFDLSVRRAEASVEYLKSFTELAGKRILELGCSYGAALSRLKETGAELVGYDWDAQIIELGRGYGDVDLRLGGADHALAAGEKPYDLVIMRHVLEHVLDPVAELSKIRQLLGKDGVLFIEVPGFLNQQEYSPDPLAIFNAFHVYGFCLETLICLMESQGFMLLNGDERITSIWRPCDVQHPMAWESASRAARVLEFMKQMEARRMKESGFTSKLRAALSNFISRSGS